MSGWRLAWTLARRELDWRVRGLRLLLACLVLGVGALAVIGSLTSAIGHELAARGATALGGDLELEVAQRSATRDELAAMARLGTVSATIRMQATAVAGAAIVPIELKGVDGRYPLLGALTLADGRTVGAPPSTEIWAGEALMQRLDARIGGRLRLGTAEFTIGGVIAEEPDRLGEGFTLGPVALASLDGIARTGLVQPGSLTQAKYRLRLSAGTDPEAAAEHFTRAFPDGGWETKTRDNATPGASRFIGRMGQFLTLVALSALAIAGIGVGNGVASYLARRRGSIAVLKVLGATSGVIGRVYALEVGLVALAGVVIGLAIGTAAVPLVVRLAGDVLPVAPAFRVEWGALAVAATYGLLIAVAFTAPPLLAAREVPAAGLLRGEADARRVGWRRTAPPVLLAGTGVVVLALLTSDPVWLAAGFLAAVAGVLTLLAGVGWLVRRGAAALPRPGSPVLRLGVAALHRPGARTGALVVALGLGLTLFVLLAAIRTSIDATVERTVPARAPALIALDVPPDREAEFRRIVTGTAPGATVATVPILRGSITGYGDTEVADLAEIPEGAWALRGDRGLTFADTMPDGSTVTAGRWWPPAYAGPPLVSVDERLAQALSLQVGDELRFTVLGVPQRATIASFRRVDWETLGFNFVLVFSPGTFAGVPYNLAATVDMDPARAPLVIRALIGPFPSVSAVEVGGVLDQLRTLIGQMATAILAATGVAVLAGIAVLVGAIAAAREARTYDSVVLRTLGATRAQVLGAQAVEYGLLAAALALVALALGIGGAWFVVVRLFGFDWAPDWGEVLATLAAGGLSVVAIGLLGSLPILSVRPARALRQL